MTTVQTRILYAIGDDCVLIGPLAGALEIARDQVGQAAALLIRRGLLERVETGCFRLTDAGRTAVRKGEVVATGVTGPRRALKRPPRVSLRQRAWNAMKILRSFTVPGLMTAAANASDGDAEENLRRYCAKLRQAGYLRLAPRREPGTAPGSNGFAIYTLVRDTGPLAPVVSPQRGAVHDFNTGEDMPCVLP